MAPGAMNETADHMGDLKRKLRNFLSGVNGGAASSPPAQSLSPDPRSVPDIGSVLRAARTQAGLELRDVAAMLKIRHVFMVAIEDGRYHELPGKAYAVGFVRAYADYLGLDCDAVVLRFKEEVASKVTQPGLYFPTPVPEGRVPGGTILLFSVVLACLVYGGWYVLSATDRSMVDMVPALPQRLVSLLEGLHGDSGSGVAVPTPAPVTAPVPSGIGMAPTPAALPLPVPPGGFDAMSSASSALSASATQSSPSPAPVSAPTTGPLLRPASPSDAWPTPSMSPGSSGLPVTPTPGFGPAPAPVVPTPGGVPSPPAALGSGTVPVVSDPGVDNGDEIPLVSGPADETVGELGPLVPMAPRNKPLPPGAAAGAPSPSAPTPISAADAESPPVLIPAPIGGAPSLPLPPPTAEPVLPTGRVYGAQNRESRIQIRATQDAWVQIRDMDGDPVFTRVLHPGDVVRLIDRPGVRLRTGNAGGLETIVDGGAPHPLGQVGQVLRDVLIDAGQLARGNPVGN